MFLFFINTLLASQQSPYDQGIEHMTNKDFSAAISAFEACIETTPSQIECHWEIGWAHWMLSDWDAVVKHWTIVENKQPGFPKTKRLLISSKRQSKIATNHEIKSITMHQQPLRVLFLKVRLFVFDPLAI